MTIRRASKWLLIAALPGGLFYIGGAIGYHSVRIVRRFIARRRIRAVVNHFREQNAIRVQKEGRA